uniref:Uncharacterized protein n=1 Tax=Aegilops tauschii subsp. strangulata TaxID=200361 RepID=A0A453SHV4_AEGTS
MANIDSVANMANTEPKQQPHGTGDMDVVPNAEQETVKTEREQTMLAPQANSKFLLYNPHASEGNFFLFCNFVACVQFL